MSARAVSDAEARAFINSIAPLAQKAFKKLGKVHPSVCIGMACVESAYGTAGSCDHHSYLGHKVGSGRTALKYWGGRFFNSITKEEYTVGKHTVIKDDFRSFDSMEQCVFNYYELINTSLYRQVLAGDDYIKQMMAIKRVGYMTSSTEVNSVLSIIKKYNLTQYDQNGGKIINAFPPCPYVKSSIIEGLKSIGVDSSFSYREKIAKANNILKYDGIAGQNTQMLNLLKEGKLLKP